MNYESDTVTRTLLCVDHVPIRTCTHYTRSQVVEWTGYLIDAHLGRLVLHAASFPPSASASASASAGAEFNPRQFFEDLKWLFAGHVSLCENLASLAGRLAHVAGKGKLPSRPMPDYCVDVIAM